MFLVFAARPFLGEVGAPLPPRPECTPRARITRVLKMTLAPQSRRPSALTPRAQQSSSRKRPSHVGQNTALPVGAVSAFLFVLLLSLSGICRCVLRITRRNPCLLLLQATRACPELLLVDCRQGNQFKTQPAGEDVEARGATGSVSNNAPPQLRAHLVAPERPKF